MLKNTVMHYQQSMLLIQVVLMLFLEAARDNNSPAMVQFSAGGSQFFAGKGLSNDKHQSAIAGGISGAMHTHQLAELYGATIILHTDHCAKKLLPWIDGLLDASEDFYRVHGKSLYSSHMIDLSEEPLKKILISVNAI